MQTLFDKNATEPCKHQKMQLVPRFPGDAWVCKSCGEELWPQPGYVDGIRDYYLPGDPPWRRHSQVVKASWLTTGESLYQCPECCFVGTVDDFDCLGADGDNLFCNQCGVEFEQCD